MKRSLTRWGIVIGLAIAAFLLYLPSETAASLTIPPDSSEYAISLSNLLEHGKFGFTLNGEWHPSRYAPWFSLTCLTPAYFLSGGSTLCYHWMILFFSLSLLGMIYFIGKKLGLGGWAVVPPVLLMLMPDYAFYSRVVMTEIPYAAIFALLAIMFVKYTLEDECSRAWCLLVGLLLAWCGMVRASGLPMVAPFVVVAYFKRRSMKDFLVRGALFTLPSVLYLMTNALYNYRVFGSPFRNGYHYWLPVPYDFSNLVFSASYIIPAIRYFSSEPIMQVTVAFAAISLLFAALVARGGFDGVVKHRPYLAFLAFGCVQSLVVVVLYVGYFWIDTRFFLGMTIYWLPLFIYAVYRLLKGIPGVWAVPAFLTLVVLCALILNRCPTRYVYMAVERPVWLAESMVTSRVLPAESVVIATGDPVVLDHFGFRDKNLTILPLARRYDYVDFMIATNSIADKVRSPQDWTVQVIPEFVAAGICSLPFKHTVLEKPEIVRDLLRKGVRVYYQKDLTFNSESKLADMLDAFSSVGVKTVSVGMWTVDPIEPNWLRSWYDSLLFKDKRLDSRPEVSVGYYEILLDERS